MATSRVLTSSFSTLAALPADISKLQSLQSLEIVPQRVSIFCPDRRYSVLDRAYTRQPSPAACSAVWAETQLEELTIPCSRVIRALPPEITQLPKLRTLRLHYCCELDELPAQLGKLHHLETLDLFQCYGLRSLPDLVGLVRLSVLRLPCCWGLQELPAAVWQLPELRELNLSTCCGLTSLQGLTTAKVQASKLTELLLANCSSLQELPAAVWQLPELRELDLSKCGSLTTLKLGQATVQASNLSKLVLAECSSLDITAGELSQLTALEELDLSDCSSLKKVPEAVWQLGRLQQLVISGCSWLEKLPAKLTQLTGLKVLTLARCSSVQVVPEAVWQLSELQKLDLSECCSLIKLVSAAELGNVSSSLTMLVLAGCISLQSLPADFAKLSKLQQLDMSNCISVQELPASNGLGQLQVLCLRECSSLASLPADTGSLENLQNLDLRGCTSLQELPAAVGRLSRLQKLELPHCSSLVALPASIGSLCQLLELRFVRCTALQYLPNIGGMSGLTSLTIQRCNKLEGIPEGMQQLTALRRLNVASCSRLAAWPELCTDFIGYPYRRLEDSLDKSSQVDFEFADRLESSRHDVGLQELQLTDCPRLSRLPDSLGVAASLTHITLQGCDSLDELPQSLGMLSNLVELQILYCGKLRSLPGSIWDPFELKVLRVEFCSSFTSLPEATMPRPDGLPIWQHIALIGCSLTHLPDCVGRLSSLKVLDLSQCSQLQALPWNMQGASQLQTLNLASCSKLSKLPEKLPASLKRLDLSHCRELPSMGESLLQVASQIGEAEVTLAGWECLIAEHLPEPLQQKFREEPILQFQDRQAAYIVLSALRRVTVIEKLLSDESFVRDLLTKLSWLATLLASAAFAAGRAPPGGWIQGGLPSCSSTTMGESTCPAGAQDWMRQFFLFNLLTFGFASGLVMFLVAFAIPRRDVGDKAATAGQMYVSLCLSVVLLSAALGCGMCALWASVLAVYPEKFAVHDVWAPFAVSLVVMGVAFVNLMLRPLLLYPGWPALCKALDPSWEGSAFQALWLLLVDGYWRGDWSVQQWWGPLPERLRKQLEENMAIARACLTSIRLMPSWLRLRTSRDDPATGDRPVAQATV